MVKKNYDIIIVGYGPAGVTAAIYAARKKLSVLLFGELPGGEVRNSGEIENWPGDGVTDGNTLAQKLVDHLKLHEDMVAVEVKKVARIEKRDDVFVCTGADGKEYQGKTVIYTAGRRPRQLGVPGEDSFRNRGITYCATCDAPLFQGKTVAVVGGGNTAAEAVIMLQKIAGKIYLLQNLEELTADPVLVDSFINDPKISAIFNAQVEELGGEVMVKKLDYKDVKTNEKKSLEVEGVFVAIGAIPNTEPVKDLIKLNRFGAIEADRYGVTSVPGFFAAGDATNIRDAQIIVAAGQGCSAALSAGDYLVRKQ
ncbi:MAG: FAD-dependent oxidoreductase [Candidatus Andersenbacteria bacterium]|nr:FAD-dependent oxidoreductase [bacterium]MDZ4225851.1 FAD-dependent oxidoreductase [Candidatus Andersenbacteria bacterium]